MARPKKTELAAVKNKNKGIIGRPKGDKAIIDEYKARMLNSPKSVKVLESIFDAALDNDHKNQAAAWKLVIDRIAPISAFDVTKGGSNGMPQISINISSFGQPEIKAEEILDKVEVSDVEFKDINYEDE